MSGFQGGHSPAASEVATFAEVREVEAPAAPHCADTSTGGLADGTHDSKETRSTLEL
jgi:hypothetical protein